METFEKIVEEDPPTAGNATVGQPRRRGSHYIKQPKQKKGGQA